MSNHFDSLDNATASRIGLIRSGAKKAITGPGLAAYYNGTPLSSLMDTPQRKAAAFLQAYKVGWFYKAESRISTDIANLERALFTENEEGGNADRIPAAALSVPFAALSPVEQFLRLMERPNPGQTGRELFAKTMIRLDMAGTAMWYLESPSTLTGLPTAIYGISPSRMWPSYDNGGRLIGWVMDRDKAGKGIPFRADEILVFAYPSADDGPWGQGVVEAVYAEIPLSERMARHTADVLETGGRLAGMMWPKDRALDEAEYVEAQRAWRNVVSDPNAARRLLVFPEPMEFATGASTPAEIGIPELANLNRDIILSAFPIPHAMVGVPMAAGLNSGETLRYVRKEYWEGSVHPRTELLEEVIQTGLVNRVEAATGLTLDFDIIEPQLDDANSLIEKAGAFRSLVALGFDADDAATAAGLDHLQRSDVPPAPAPVAVEPLTGPTVAVTDSSRRDSVVTQQSLAKASKAMSEADREAIMEPLREQLAAIIEQYLERQREAVISAVEMQMPKRKSARKSDATDWVASWWEGQDFDSDLEKAVRDLIAAVGPASGALVADALSVNVTPDDIEAITDELLRFSGEEIRVGRGLGTINEATRTAIMDAVGEGTRRGYSIYQMVNGVPGEQYTGLRDLRLGNGVSAWDRSRAEVIARTETMNALNRASLIGFGRYGVESVMAVDGDYDALCAARNGTVVDRREAFNAKEHPNGTLYWVPLTDSIPGVTIEDGKSARTDVADLAAAIATLAAGPASKTTVSYGDITVPTPQVTVEPPVVNVAPAPVTVDLGPVAEAIKAQQETLGAFATALADHGQMIAGLLTRLDALNQPVTKHIKRDERGQIVSVEERRGA